ncbi:MAG: 1,4-alpha-glucan branching protein GlgB [Oscillospiraceae bacterium]|nr:1,4-alpha-glucan branching protein GlgB [Oscillospiraceae bacterium]
MLNQQNEKTLPAYLFHQGTNYRTYEYLGCHFDRASGKAVFRTWAPSASSVYVVGDFNNWDEKASQMTRVSDGGVWETTLEEISENQRYKYAIFTASGKRLLKADPYAFYSETEDKTASIVYDLNGFNWTDALWQQSLRKSSPLDGPMNIYEVHIGSWMRSDDGSLLGYVEIAQKLISYMLEMNYTHLELMPVMEHPFGGSWGYQICGYFAPTSRYGTPHDFMKFVDLFHNAGIAVILDWVPSHFPKDEHGLIEYDGGSLYEAHGADKQEQPEWGTRCFDYGRTEVQSFLVSNAMYWFHMFHIDGLRVDAVSSMLYLDYGREHGGWIPNSHGGNENLDAIAFLKKLNTAVFEFYPNALMIAEESTAWPLVSAPIHDGGLGFNFKWNMGWMNDMLSYVETDPIYRRHIHEKITFSFLYAFSENFILPISHDEVVHGKKSLLDKMPGDYDNMFAGFRAFLSYMMTHPGKKLSFMGSEFGQFKEWDIETQLDWFLLDYPMHNKLKHFTSKLGAFYLQTPALWEIDYSWEGFRWIHENDRDQNIISFIRTDKKGEYIIVVINFSPVARFDYPIGVPENSGYIEVFNSDLPEFGGWDNKNASIVPKKTKLHGFDQSVSLTVPPLGMVVLKKSK